MNNKLKEITEVIQKAVPEIMELKFGCRVEVDFTNENFIGNTFEKAMVIFQSNEPNKIISVYRKGVGVFNDISKFKILGRDITLEDVMRVCEKQIAINEEGEFLKFSEWNNSNLPIETDDFQEEGYEGTGIYWAWNTPLHLQKTKVWDLLHDLLVKKI